MILSCSSICKSFGSDDILKNASFHIEEHEKAAVVGINGAGKSTLRRSSPESFRQIRKWSSPRERPWATWPRTRTF